MIEIDMTNLVSPIPIRYTLMVNPTHDDIIDYVNTHPTSMLIVVSQDIKSIIPLPISNYLCVYEATEDTLLKTLVSLVTVLDNGYKHEIWDAPAGFSRRDSSGAVYNGVV